MPTLPEAEQQGLKLSGKMNATTMAALRAKRADELLQATDRQLEPIIDGYVVPEDVYSVYASGRQIKVPILIGSLANERGNYPQPKSMQEYMEYTRREYPDAVDEVMKVFPASSDDGATRAYLIRERDRFAATMRTWAEFVSRSGMPAYLFYFDRKPPARTGETALGAVHTSEIVYFRNTLDKVDRPWTAQDRKLADIMSSYLVNFATTGNPNGKGLPNWPSYKAGQVMELGDNVEPIPTPDERELAWFDQYFSNQHGLSKSNRRR
jgi:para-nitrobenzyl esterase